MVFEEQPKNVVVAQLLTRQEGQRQRAPKHGLQAITGFGRIAIFFPGQCCPPPANGGDDGGFFFLAEVSPARGW